MRHPPWLSALTITFLVLTAVWDPCHGRGGVGQRHGRRRHPGGHLTLYPADRALPQASTINFAVGKNRANNSILLLGREAPHVDVVAVWPVLAGAGEVDLIVDLNGYFD